MSENNIDSGPCDHPKLRLDNHTSESLYEVAGLNPKPARDVEVRHIFVHTIQHLFFSPPFCYCLAPFKHMSLRLDSQLCSTVGPSSPAPNQQRSPKKALP